MSANIHEYMLTAVNIFFLLGNLLHFKCSVSFARQYTYMCLIISHLLLMCFQRLSDPRFSFFKQLEIEPRRTALSMWI